MNWSFRLGRIWGIDIHVHWLLPAFILFRILPRLAGQLPAWAIGIVVLLELSVFGIVLLHELGHCWAARKEGLSVHRILLWPFGGLAMIGGGTERPETEFKVAISGPLVNVGLAFAAAALLLAAGHPIAPFGSSSTLSALLLNRFMELNIIIFLFNLIPCFPMDGGRILRSLLSRRMGAVRASLVTANVALVLAVVIGVGGLFLTRSFVFPFLALWLGFQAWQEKKRFQLGAAMGYGGQTVYWRGRPVDLDLGPRPEPPKKKGPSWLQRHKARKTMKRWLAENERQEKIKADVDQVLDKMNRLGFDGLSSQEQKILREASELKEQDAP